jgi:DNA-binding LacI/PurR family transcriptional regulator
MEKISTQRYPASVRVMQTLQERIARGHYVPGAWLPPERELAREFAVSRPIIRVALSGLQQQGLVVRDPGCRPRVQAVTAAQTSPEATGPAGRTLQTIAAILPQQPTYVSAHAILRGISQVLQQKEAPYRLTIVDTHPAPLPADTEGSGPSQEQSFIEKAIGGEVAGIIIWHVTWGATLSALRRLQERNLPIVFIDRYPAEMDCDYVGVDNRHGVREAADYLLGLGHRRIAYLTTDEQVSTVAERKEGYQEAFLARGIVPPPELIYSVPVKMQTSMETAAAYFLSLPDPPTALVADNDLHAFAFIREAQARGRRVPEDISVIGFDDIECYSPHPAMLTTVHQPFYQIGQRAAELLLRRLASPGASPSRSFQHVVLSTSLVLRSTCRPYPATAGSRA